ncbi:cartilage matrix protein-like [Lineus longissimus]|uniref:cartilage matrix protein-like n=1 Tax=Lineus longissimus TaxID=88925 RepID=UPI00315CA763
MLTDGGACVILWLLLSGANVAKTTAAPCNPNAQVDIYFMIDASGSVKAQNFPHLLQFVNILIGSLPIGQNQVRVGVYRFNHQPTFIFPLNRYYNKAAMQRAVSAIRFTAGTTGTFRVLRQMRLNGFTAANGDRPGVHNIGILITDGISNNPYQTIAEATACKRAGIELFCVGAQIPSMKEVTAIASKPKKPHLFRVNKFHQMKSQAPAIFKKICSQISKYFSNGE